MRRRSAWLAAAVLCGCSSSPAPVVGEPERATAGHEGLHHDPSSGGLPFEGELRRFDGASRRLLAVSYLPGSSTVCRTITGEVRGGGHAPRPFVLHLGRRVWAVPLHLDHTVAPELGTLLVFGDWRTWYGLTANDELVQIRKQGWYPGEPAPTAVGGQPFLDPCGPKVVPQHGDVEWVLSALSGPDPVLRLNVLHFLGGELLPAAEVVRGESAAALHSALERVRADPRVHERVRAARASPVAWIREAAILADERLTAEPGR
ncbi:MAG: hypothetical protein M9894_18085 [Planctomycetes bacterium]|nr:hypothetical protein [Planctomycetota bacterium]